MLGLFFSAVPVKADWESDANTRIEQNRKRDVQITVVDLEGYPVSNVDVQIDQTRHQFGFGTALAYGKITNTDHQDFVVDHFEWAVCENEMKWSSNESQNDNWTFSQADYIADFCADNDIKLRGHNLVWETGGQTPSWVSGLDCSTYPPTSEMMDEIDDRINTTVGRYAGQIVSWDVDNEMLSGNMFDCLGETGRAHFFQQGNSVDPNCGFYMNEYSGNSFTGYDGDPYAARALGLIALGAPVEGLGIQAHVASPFDPERYYNNVLQELAVVGVPIIATEFDTDASTEAQAADDLENLYRICFSHPLVEGIIMWGYDQNVWRGNGIVNDDTWVLNQAGVRYEALLDEWTTNTSDTTDINGEADFRGFHGTYEITLTPPDSPAEVYTIELEPGSGTAEFELQVNVGPPDETPPSPDPMEWAVDGEPEALGPTNITMTAATATDNNPPVEYYFECTNYSAASSNWQTGTTYEAQGLAPSTLYTFKVKARDSSAAQNETAFSGTASATTDPPDLIAPEPDPMTWATGGQPAATGPSSIIMTATTAADDSPPVQYYFECTNYSAASSDWQTSPTYEAEGLNPSTQYTFKVMARDSSPAQNETDFSGTASATTEAPPTDIEILGSWTTGTSHAKESGYSRALIFIAHCEHSTTVSLGSVTYGGQAMTKVIERNTGGTGYQAYVAAYILDEAGVNAATSGTFSPDWSTTPENVSYGSVFLANVNQTTSIGASASNSATSGATIMTSALATGDGDFVIDAVICGNVGDYAMNNGFTKPFEQDMSSSTSADGYKFATGVDETPSATFTGTMNRQAIIGFVINAMESTIPDYPPAAPTGLVATAGNESISLDWNDNSEPDVIGYNVYRNDFSGSGYVFIDNTSVGESNYVDNNLNNFEQYSYEVTAVDANNESEYSSPASAIPHYQTCADVQAAEAGLVSDLTGNCYVNLEDLEVLAGYWLNTNCGALGNCGGADFEPDGDVDFEDYSDFAVDWLECDNPQDANCPQSWWPTE